jgi:hypothetical protein
MESFPFVFGGLYALCDLCGAIRSLYDLRGEHRIAADGYSARPVS